MTPVADLHCHSTWSDGELTPLEIIQRAVELKLKAVSVTDHDTLSGYQEAADAAEDAGIDYAPGVELTVAWRGRVIHLLGYGIFEEDEGILELCAELRQWRRERHSAMRGALVARGLLPPDGVEHAEGVALGRVHLARELVAAGRAATIDEAFAKHLADMGGDYPDVTVERAVKIIHKAGGLVVVAHPGPSNLTADLRELLDVGVDGWEVWHPAHDEHEAGRLSALAEQLGAVKSGGSDSHTRERLGCEGLSAAAWKRLARGIY